MRGLQQALRREKKRLSIFRAEIERLKRGEPARDRAANKKISRQLDLPYEYVMKVRRELKEGK